MGPEPWFSDRGIGALFLLPVHRWGWLCLLGFVVALAATAVSHSDVMPPVRIGLCVAYLALSYFKSDRWPRS